MATRSVHTVQLSSTRDCAIREVLGTFGFLYHTYDGERLILLDGERHMEVSLVVSRNFADTNEVAVEQLRFRFDGYSEEEAEELLEQYLVHRSSQNEERQLRDDGKLDDRMAAGPWNTVSAKVGQ